MSCEDNECIGCKASTDYHCTLPTNIDGHICPCLNCLIKGICVIDCNSIGEYADLHED